VTEQTIKQALKALDEMFERAYGVPPPPPLAWKPAIPCLKNMTSPKKEG
jgi:hypothetical protein